MVFLVGCGGWLVGSLLRVCQAGVKDFMWSCPAGLAGSNTGRVLRLWLVSMQNSGKFMSLETVKCKDKVDLYDLLICLNKSANCQAKDSLYIQCFICFDLLNLYLNICIYACMIAWIPGEEQLKSCEKHQLKAVNITMRQGVLLGNLPQCRPGFGKVIKGSSFWQKQGKGRTFRFQRN